jgi:hypothetical protein
MTESSREEICSAKRAKVAIYSYEQDSHKILERILSRSLAKRGISQVASNYDVSIAVDYPPPTASRLGVQIPGSGGVLTDISLSRFYSVPAHAEDVTVWSKTVSITVLGKKNSFYSEKFTTSSADGSGDCDAIAEKVLEGNRIWQLIGSSGK